MVVVSWYHQNAVWEDFSARIRIDSREDELASKGSWKKKTEMKTANELESEKWYSIDNDNYEVKLFQATLLSDGIKMFSHF